MPNSIQVAITRKVKKGMEDEFENAIREFWSKAINTPGSLGAQLIRPMPGDNSNVYGIIRSFASIEDHDTFYNSEQFSEWRKFIRPYVESGYTREKLHGMEAFFSTNGIKAPITWKMAFVTWFGVWPCVYLAYLLLGPVHDGWPVWLGMGMETAAVVCALTWVVMPFLSKLFGPWLTKS